jgi:hypothetical protein
LARQTESREYNPTGDTIVFTKTALLASAAGALAAPKKQSSTLMRVSRSYSAAVRFELTGVAQSIELA